MNSSETGVRALGLCSGGLDSILSALILKKQGVDVEWIAFETPFFSADKAIKASEMTGIPLTVQTITPVYLEMLRRPRCGYGKHMNPCLDCHALMFRLAGELMTKKNMQFMFSGEVLGQRPMSQTRPSLRYVEKHSGFDGYILRPLSAGRLPETIPERNGWVDRNLLCDLAGRSRKPQIRLAEEFGISDYPAPAGGCLLTDSNYANRLKDVFEHEGPAAERDLDLLKYGRHFRLNPQAKIIVGRTRQDNDRMLRLYRPETDVILKTGMIAGPVVLLPYGGSSGDISLAASMCATYSKAPENSAVDVEVTTANGTYSVMAVSASADQFRQLMV